MVKSAHQPQWNPLQWDAIAQFYPWRVFYTRSMHEGHIPLWNPHQFCGTPFLANGQSAVLYPLNLIFLLFNPISGFTAFAFIHLLLAAIFMYLLLKELGCRTLGGIIGAVTFTFSAFMVLWLELPTFISVAAYLPLVLLLIHRAVERRSVFYGMLSGFAVALAVLAGHFQIAFYVVMAAGLWWLWKLLDVRRSEGTTYAVLKVVIPCIGFLIIAGLICAPQFLSSIELAKNSHRTREVTAEGYQVFVDNAVKPYHLVTALMPKFFGTPSRSHFFPNYYIDGRLEGERHVCSAADYMEYGMYAGVLPLMLAIIGASLLRRKRHVGFFVILTLFALFTALGTPINRLFYYAIPGFSALGGPNRILLLYLFGVAALAGFGADYMVEKITGSDEQCKREHRRKLRTVIIAVAAVGALALIFSRVAMPAVYQMIGLTIYDEYACSPAVVVFIAAYILISVSIIATAIKPANAKAFAVLAVLITVIELFEFGMSYNPTCGRAKVYPETKLTTKLKSLPDNTRIAPINPTWSLFSNPEALFPPNAAMVYGLYDMQGYDSLFTRAYKELSCKIQNTDSSPPENGNMVLFRQGIPEQANYVLSKTKLRQVEMPRMGLMPRLVGRYDGVYVYDTGKSYGSALAGCKPDKWRAISSEWDNETSWLGPNIIAFRNINTRAEYVQLDSINYPGWVARSGNKVLVRNTKVNLPNHRIKSVTLSFEPYTFRLGLFMMLTGVCMLCCVGTFRVLRRKLVRR